MRQPWLRVLSTLPVFLAGCVAVLIAYQVRLGYLQAASTGFGGSSSSTAWGRAAAGSQTQLQGGGDRTSTAAAAAAAAAAGQQAHGGPDHPPGADHQHRDKAPAAKAGSKKDTLVVYVFNEDDPVFADNFHFFLLAGVQQDSRCDYVVLVHERSLKSPGDLPVLPAVQYVYYPGSCYEWGMLGWLLGSGHLALGWRQRYEFYVLLSSAVRGPFLPPYLQGSMHWTEPLLSRLNGRVKLVGPVINCGAVPSDARHPNAAAWSSAPHLPFHALATDRTGLSVLVDAGVTRCRTDVWREKYEGEAGASLALLAAGYSLDCLLLRYQGVDWREPSAWGCNRGLDPSGPGAEQYDGTYLDPMEVVFARVDSPSLAAKLPGAVKAVKYSAWAVDLVSEAVGAPHNHSARVSGNAFAASRGPLKLPRILAAVVRGSACFDADFFIDHNRDLFGSTRRSKIDPQVAWRYFVYIAQFEDRPFRYTCAFNWSAIAAPSF